MQMDMIKAAVAGCIIERCSKNSFLCFSFLLRTHVSKATNWCLDKLTLSPNARPNHSSVPNTSLPYNRWQCGVPRHLARTRLGTGHALHPLLFRRRRFHCTLGRIAIPKQKSAAKWPQRHYGGDRRKCHGNRLYVVQMYRVNRQFFDQSLRSIFERTIADSRANFFSPERYDF